MKQTSKRKFSLGKVKDSSVCRGTSEHRQLHDPVKSPGWNRWTLLQYSGFGIFFCL